MNRFAKLAAAAGLLLISSSSLGGCAATVEKIVGSVVTQPATAVEVHTTSAAGHIYNAVSPLADGLVKSAACSKECRHTVGTLSHDVRVALDDALTAEAKGDSAATQLALDAFNLAFPKLTGFLNQNGVATP